MGKKKTPTDEEIFREQFPEWFSDPDAKSVDQFPPEEPEEEPEEQFDPHEQWYSDTDAVDPLGVSHEPSEESSTEDTSTKDS